MRQMERSTTEHSVQIDGFTVGSGPPVGVNRTWSGCGDLNPGPPAPKAGALPSCATSRYFVVLNRHFTGIRSRWLFG
jgi:hypothetical protein